MKKTHLDTLWIYFISQIHKRDFLNKILIILLISQIEKDTLGHTLNLLHFKNSQERLLEQTLNLLPGLTGVFTSAVWVRKEGLIFGCWENHVDNWLTISITCFHRLPVFWFHILFRIQTSFSSLGAIVKLYAEQRRTSR